MTTIRTEGRGRRTAGFSACVAVLVLMSAGTLVGQFHRAEQDREISYWLNDPATHTFLISHDFTVSKEG